MKLSTALFCLLALTATPAGSFPPPGDQPPRMHRHDPIVIPGEPIVERLRIRLQQPRRVLIDRSGNRDIADSGSGKVLRLSRRGQVTTLAEKLNEPSGLARDREGNLYVSNHAHGEKDAGSLVRISADGKQTTVVAKLTAPKGLAIDAVGNVFVALFAENRIIKVDRQGRVTEFAAGIDTPAALVFDGGGNLLVTSAVAGIVSRISPAGKVSVAARGLSIPSDIVIGPAGLPLIAEYGGTHLTQITADGKTRPYITVPQGTIGIAVNPEGNLVFVNWDLAMAVKVTTRLSIPCPHCRKKIPVRIRPRVKPAKKKKKQPVI